MEQTQKFIFATLLFLILTSIAGFYFYENNKTESTKKLDLQSNTEKQNNDTIIASVDNAFVVKNDENYSVKLNIEGIETIIDTCAIRKENSEPANFTKVCGYNNLSFSPSKNYLTYSKLAYEDGEIIMYDIKNKTAKSFPSGNTIGFTNDEKYLFVCAGNELAGNYYGKIYDVKTLKEIYTVPEYYSTPSESPYSITKCSYDNITGIISFTSEDIFNPIEKKLPKNMIDYDTKNNKVLSKTQNIPAQPKNNDLLPEVLVQKSIDYINKSLLSNATATLDEIDSAGTINTLYQFNMKISGQSFISYVSADGKYLFPQEGYILTEKEATGNNINEKSTPNINVAAAEAVVQKALNYINNNLLSDGSVATLDKINSANTISKLYKFTVIVSGESFVSYISADGKYLFAQTPTNLNEETSNDKVIWKATFEGGFKEAKDIEVCTENNKPIIYFFSSTACPHCKWEEPVLKSVVDQFGSNISYHENIDSDRDWDVFSRYSSGSVPTLVIGCKYYRVGSGESAGIEAEKSALKKIICRATENIPANICE